MTDRDAPDGGSLDEISPDGGSPDGDAPAIDPDGDEQADEFDAVLFDIGGVIVDLASIREGYAVFVDDLASEYDLDPDEALDVWKRELGAHFKGRQGTEYRTAAEGYRKATEAVFADFDAEAAEAAWRERFDAALDATLRPEPGAVETIRALDEAGVYLGVVSDIDTREAEDMLSSFGVRECFDDLTTSEEVGHTKPDARMFETAIDRAGLPPGRTLMVGDRYRHDVEGAAAAGLVPVAYGEEAAGPDAAFEIDDLRDLLAVVGLEDGG